MTAITAIIAYTLSIKMWTKICQNQGKALHIVSLIRP